VGDSGRFRRLVRDPLLSFERRFASIAEGKGGYIRHMLYNDPEHWRKRANEAREVAQHMTDAKGKAAMLEIADTYDQIAKAALERPAQQGEPQ
jgi:hypothetical protein